MAARLMVVCLVWWFVATVTAQESIDESVSADAVLIDGDGVVPEAMPLVVDEVVDEVVDGDSSFDGGPCPHEAGSCPDCARGVREYVVFDALFLDRDNATNNQPILVDSQNGLNPGGTIFTTRSMTPTTATGVRLFVGRHSDDATGWEMGYWSAYGWYGDARADVAGGLAIPGDLGAAVDGWNTASTVRAGWSSSLNVVELNLLRSNFSEGCEPCSRWPSRRCRQETEFDWIGGLFWAGLDEQAALRVNTSASEPATAYRVATASNLFGGQVGARGRRTWDRFAVEGFLKAGLGGAWLSQSASPITSSLTLPLEYRKGREGLDTGMGFLSSMNLSAIYRFTDVWGLRIGYNLAWLSGVALAPNQWDFTDTTGSGTGVRGAGGVFLHGANLGLEAQW